MPPWANCIVVASVWHCQSCYQFVRGAQEALETSATGGRPQLGDSDTDRGPAVAVVPPPADTMPPGLADHPDYEVIRELGRGGMGVVYLVRNKLMGRLEVLQDRS